jgi:single-strand DNA-binding protein
MDKCFFIGRVVRDPKIGANGDNQYASFSLAVDTGYGDNKKAHFFNFVVFGKSVDAFDRYVRQGTKLAIESEARQNVWTDKDGNKRYDVNFVVMSWEFAGGKSGENTQEDKASTAPSPDQAEAKPDTSFIAVPEGVEESLPW